MLSSANERQEDNEAPPTENINFDKIPLIALRQTSYGILSKLLNASKLIPSENGGLPRDWRGISDLIGIEYRSDILLSEDRVKKIFDLWNLDKNYSDTASFGNLLKFLCEIDRWDVYDDLQTSLAEDARIYIQKQKDKLASKNEYDLSSDKYNYESESDVLTVDDARNRRDGNSLQKYDALIIYADEDVEFVRKVVQEMENRGIKICIKERDLLGGITFEHEASMRLVSERCNRLIVIISSSFYLSPANRFIVNYATAIGIEQGKRKIIPCIYERCKLQPPLDIYFALNYPRSIGLWNFWDKLFESLQITTTANNQLKFFAAPTATITDVTDSADKIKNDINKNSISLPSQPIKIPRRKKLSFPNSLPSLPDIDGQNSNSDNSSAIQSRNLENLDNLSIGSSVFNGSPPDLLKPNGAIKKKNWYKKIFSSKNKLFKSEDNNDNIKNDNVKEKGKRNFLRKLVSA